MMIDTLANFVPLGSNLPILGVPVASNPYDALGVGVGVAPPVIIGNRTLFGTDLGIGGNKPQLEVLTNVAFAGPAGALLAIAFQGAPDTGAAGGYQPGAWTSLLNQDGLTIAELAAQSVVFRMDWPPALPANLNARFFRMLFTPVAASAFTAGSIGAAFVTMGRDDQANKYATKNFTV
jgi:hypothetical protein